MDGSSKLDAPADTGSSLCFGSFVAVCLRDAPSSSITVNSGATLTYDTQASSPDCVATTPDVGACVVAATSITVNGTIRGTGPRPLILLATDSITVNSGGVIDVASRRGGPNLGAGANPPSRCQSGTAPTERTGAWGGSNASKGGDGNEAGGSNASGGDAASALPRPTALFGGCAGGNGAGGSGGIGGAGGGAVDLIAATMIAINGTVNASGAGANGASDNGAGGGGGGSGGLIVLDAPTVTINGSARVFAQGGAGGEGGRSGGGGNAGADPTTPGQAAQGGSGAGSGGDGGAGATTGDGGDGGEDGGGIIFDDGGGGGGGGRGFIITTDPTPPNAQPSQVCPAFS